MGYYRIVQPAFDHPLAISKGRVATHRFVLWEKLNGQDAPCHWCGKALVWRRGNGGADTLCADHVDGDLANNDPVNLVPSCRGCNGNRGRQRRQTAPCEYCGSSFVKSRPESRFCSMACATYQQWATGKGHHAVKA